MEGLGRRPGAGTFMVGEEEIAYVRDQWIREGCVPRTTMSGQFRIRAISRKIGKQVCTVRAAPKHHFEIEAWLGEMRKLGVDLVWSGQSIGTLTLMAVEQMLKVKRQDPTAEMKRVL